ncbi:polyubiquitin 3 [Tanacetum coccineum]
MEGIIPADSRNLQYIYNVNDDMDPTCRPVPWGMFKLFVHRLTTGETFTVFVSKDDTIMELKCKIWEEANSYFIPSCQKLFFTGIMLKNEKSTLADYNICGESTIDLFTDQGGKLKLFIETLSGKKISLDVYITYSISKVKTLIQDKEGIPSERQKLVYAGQQLDDSLKLQDYCLQRTSTFLLLDDEDDISLTRERTLRIHVNIIATGTTVELDVKSTDTVDHVKSMIQEKEDIPRTSRLYFCRRSSSRTALLLTNTIFEMILPFILSKLLNSMKAKIVGKEILPVFGKEWLDDGRILAFADYSI